MNRTNPTVTDLRMAIDVLAATQDNDGKWTPAARDYKGGYSTGGDVDLASTIDVLLPTPTARDWRGANQRNDTTCLPGAVAQRWGDYAAAVERAEHVAGRPAPHPVEGTNTKRRLSPAFVEWLMLLPEGWVTGPIDRLDLTAARKRNAALERLGNGVVPAQALLALSLLDPLEADQ